MCGLAVAALVTVGAGAVIGGGDEQNARDDTRRGDRAMPSLDRLLDREPAAGSAAVDAGGGGADGGGGDGGVPGVAGDVGVVGATPEPASDGGARDDVGEGEAPVEPTVTGEYTVALTFYNCYGQGGGYCGTMASGATVYDGAAACGDGFSLGTRFTIVGDPTGRVYTCEDRGLGGPMWVDVFFWAYASGRAWRNSVDADVDGKPDQYVEVVLV